MKFLHKVQYYETDKMQVTHHSNYIRFMEEARTAFLEKVGYSYKRMEEENIISPVIGVEAKFLKSTTYGDEIDIEVGVKKVTSAVVTIGYTMTANGAVVCTGESNHCFLKNGRPIAIKKISPQLYDLFLKFAEEYNEEN